MSIHKIQSNSSMLHLDLDPVPKMLLKLKTLWAPESYVISFKLETDPDLVISKARGAIAKYHVDMVIANQLQVICFRLILSSCLIFGYRLEKTSFTLSMLPPLIYHLSLSRDFPIVISSKTTWSMNALDSM